jgi:hypothetical protein
MSVEELKEEVDNAIQKVRNLLYNKLCQQNYRKQL